MKTKLEISVEAPDGTTHEKVAEIIEALLDVGQADAIDTKKDPDIDSPDADLASLMSFSVKKNGHGWFDWHLPTSIVVLKSDMAGEDSSYTIGAVELPETVDVEKFKQEAISIFDKLRQNQPYEDSDVLVELEKRGYKVVSPPFEIVVRD